MISMNNKFNFNNGAYYLQIKWFKNYDDEEQDLPPTLFPAFINAW